MKKLRKLLLALMAVLMSVTVFTGGVRADDGDGNVTLTSEMEGDDTRTVEAVFDISSTGTSGKWNFQYSDSWFRNPASEYNHQLARLSLGMALSAFRPKLDPDAEFNPALHLHDFLRKCEFECLRTDDYDKNPSLYTVSTVMAYKDLQDDKGPFTLIAVGVCGGGYKNEWMSNFTMGTDEIHTGFFSAASEVYDRLFGYIAMNGLTGRRFKVWVSGFSRAAAISNVFAKLVVDSSVFEPDDVFAYTFATPRTTKRPHAGEYPNIYNICGKMDPVPMVPFADWGYDRFGTTLYTPAQETDSNYRQMARRAGIMHELYFDLRFFNNVEWNTRLRVIMNYLLKIAPASSVYTTHMQETVVDMWEDKSISNIISSLMKLANNEELINDNNKTEANSLLTYIMYTVYGYLTGSDIEAKYRNEKATFVGNLAREHTPEVYLAWMYSTTKPEELFHDSLDYMRIVIDGNVDVAIRDGGMVDRLLKVVKADGTYADKFDLFPDSVDSTGPDIFVERINGEHIILLPKDHDYTIYIKSNIDQKVEMHAIPLKVGYTNAEFNQIHYAEMEADEYEAIMSQPASDLVVDGGFDIVAGDTFESININPSNSGELGLAMEKFNIFNLEWRELILLAYATPVFLVCTLFFLVSWAVGAHRLKSKKKLGIVPASVKYDWRPAACIYGAIAIFLLQELLYWLMPQYILQRGILKLVIDLLLLYLAYSGYRRQRSALSRSIIIALILCIIADLTINLNFSVGMLLFAVAEVYLAYTFVKFENPERWQYVLGATVIIAFAAVIILNNQLNTGSKTFMTIYSTILATMVCSSLTMPKKIRFATIALMLSNSLTFIEEVSTRYLIMHVLSLGIYYLAIGCFAFSTRFKVRYNNPVQNEGEKKNAEEQLSAVS